MFGPIVVSEMSRRLKCWLGFHQLRPYRECGFWRCVHCGKETRWRFFG